MKDTAEYLRIVQIFLYDAFKGVRKESGNEIPIFALQSVSASAFLHLWGPEAFGGNGDIAKKLEAIGEANEDLAAADERVRTSACGYYRLGFC